MSLLIDVSNLNGSVDWARVKATGIAGAYIKLTEGVNFDDPLAFKHAQGCDIEHLPYGFYHFARPDHNTAKQEVDHVRRRLGKHGSPLRLALDLEQGKPIPAYGEWAHEFSQRLHDYLGYFPVFYSYPYYIQGLKLTKTVGDGLWLASYSRNDGVEHPYVVPEPWKKAVMHQFSSQSRVTGVQGLVDLSYAKTLRSLHT